MLMSASSFICAIHLKQHWLELPKINLPYIPQYDVIYHQARGPDRYKFKCKTNSTIREIL